MEKNYYEILGIKPDATDNEIKSAFRKLARKWHPDVAGDSQEVVNKFKELNEAYEILSNPEKRKKYDTIRGIFNQAKSQKNTTEKDTTTKKTTNNTETNRNTTSKKTESKENKTETKASSTKTNQQNNKNAFQDAWENFLKKTKESDKPKQTKYTAKKIDGKDITSEITITVLEALQGTTRSVNILHTEPCPKCHGRKFANGGICAYCKGAGEISVHKKLSVRIPEKVKHGSKIRIAGEGNQGINGGKNGDLYLIIKVDTEHSRYQYDGLNILQTIPIEPYEAVLGCTVDVKTPEGIVQMKIMPNTMNGQKYRLAKEGLEKDGKKGDMIVTISIEIPKDITAEERILYEKLKLAANRNIREKIYE